VWRGFLGVEVVACFSPASRRRFARIKKHTVLIRAQGFTSLLARSVLAPFRFYVLMYPETSADKWKNPPAFCCVSNLKQRDGFAVIIAVMYLPVANSASLSLKSSCVYNVTYGVVLRNR